MTDTVEVPGDAVRAALDAANADGWSIEWTSAQVVVAAAAPLLRAQWERELREQIAAEIDRTREDDYLQRQGSPLCEQRNDHDCHMAASQASLDWAARIVRRDGAS